MATRHSLQYTDGLLLIQHHFEKPGDVLRGLNFKYAHIVPSPKGKWRIESDDGGVVVCEGPVIHTVPPNLSAKVICIEPGTFYCLFSLNSLSSIEELQALGDINFLPQEAQDFIRENYGEV